MPTTGTFFHALTQGTFIHAHKQGDFHSCPQTWGHSLTPPNVKRRCRSLLRANSFYADGGIPPQQGQLLYRQHSSAMVVDIPVVLTGGPIIMPASSAIHNNNYTISYVFPSFLPPVRRCCLRKCSGEWLSDKPFEITRYVMIT